MDETRFREAQQAYDAGDWRGAAKGFLAAAGNQTVGSGKALHMAGNALMKLRRFGDAATVYRHALEDDLYGKRGAVLANLGAAYVALGSYDEAAQAYREATEDPEYVARWRAAQGLAGALYEMGRFDEAAQSYREAALDAGNPDPGKALNNLGLAYMGAGKPAEAIEAYKASCETEGYSGAGKACANLGFAYGAVGEHSDAVKAFEKAIHFFGYDLTPAARSAFDASREALQQPLPEVVEGWTTGEMAPVPPYDPDATVEMPALSGVNPDADTDFFHITDEQMRDRDREVRRAERVARREGRSTLKVWLVMAAIVVLVVSVLTAAWFSGLGYPTQAQAVKGLLKARKAGQDVRSYWVAVPAANVDKEMATLPPDYRTFTIDQVDRSATTSRAQVTVTLDRGAPLRYSITLAREGVGWKINGISNDWRSTGGGS